MTHVKEKNLTVYFMGCPCHIVHNCALKASEKFAQVRPVGWGGSVGSDEPPFQIKGPLF